MGWAALSQTGRGVVCGGFVVKKKPFQVVINFIVYKNANENKKNAIRLIYNLLLYSGQTPVS